MAAIDLTALYREGLAHQHAGRLAEAIAVYDRVLALKPDIAEVLFQKARCLPDDPEAAEALFRAALKLKPQEAAIWQGLHGVLQGKARAKLEAQATKAGVLIGSEADLAKARALWGQGDEKAAEAEALRVGKAAPQAFWPVYTLGLMREGAAALPALEAAHARDPSHSGARLALAQAALSVGQIRRVEQLLDAPGLPPQATLVQAQMLRETAQPDAAADLLANGPLRDRTWQVELAVCNAAAGRSDEAQTALAHAIKAGAPRVGTSRRVALAAEAAGDVPTAEAIIDDAIAAKPTATLLIQRGQLRQSAGDLEAGLADLEAALQQDPANGEAFRALANGRKVTADGDLPARIDAALDSPHVPASHRAGLYFAAAKCAMDQRRYGDVMDALHRANRLMAQAFPYGFDADLEAVRHLIADWQVLEPVSAPGPEVPVIFVTGLPRSGTTLVESILGAHEQARAGGEMAFLNQALAPVLDALRRGEQPTPEALSTAGARYLTLAGRATGQPSVIVDKAISTFSRMGHALRMLPGARFVHVTRDPRDVGLSLYRNRFPDWLHRYAYDLSEMGRYIRLHDAVTGFWHKALKDRVHVISYEALTADPEKEIRSLLQAADLAWDPACLAPQESARRIQTLSFAQARDPIGRASVAGWRRFEDDLAPLCEALEGDIEL